MTLDKPFGRLGIFVDGENLSAALNESGFRVNFRKLLDFLTSKFACTGFSAFYVDKNLKEPSWEKQQLYYKIRQSGFITELTEPYFKYGADEANPLVPGEKFNVDGEMLVQMAKRMQDFDTFVIVAGDSDYQVFVRTALNQHKRVVIVYVSERTASYLYRNNPSIDSVNLNSPEVKRSIELNSS